MMSVSVTINIFCYMSLSKGSGVRLQHHQEPSWVNGGVHVLAQGFYPSSRWMSPGFHLLGYWSGQFLRHGAAIIPQRVPSSRTLFLQENLCHIVEDYDVIRVKIISLDKIFIYLILEESRETLIVKMRKTQEIGLNCVAFCYFKPFQLPLMVFLNHIMKTWFRV